ncbi:DUF222 domain-containing protein [Egicoccus sp. AB-alg2]|uniref:HNH endonuclease n=1 Tax=Egicoccus sp. AB-alg2 TaxID=3242693 RepID=UPI00359D0AD2
MSDQPGAAEAGGPPVGLGDLAVAEQRELGWEQLFAHARALGPDPRFADLSDDQLEVTLHTRAVEATIVLARLFDVLAEFVVRGIWADQGARTPGAWLSWKLGLGASTAREWVRVALRLRELPAIRDRFAAGTLSYSKVRALTRIALPDAQEWLLAWADHATAAELERVARGLRGAQRGRLVADDPDHGWTYRLTTRHDGLAELTVVGPVEEIVELELRCRRAAEQQLADRRRSGPAASEEPTDAGSASAEAVSVPEPPDDDREPWVTAADVARTLAEAVVVRTDGGPPDTSGLDRHTLVLQAPADALAALNPPTGHDVPHPRQDPVPVRDAAGRIRSLDRRVLRRLACEAGIVLAVTNAHHQPIDLGRRRRDPSAALRRAVFLRDHHSCRYPGCGSTRNLHVHHVRHWADGGPTDLANLITLCAHHHRHLHRRHDDGRGIEVRVRPDGRHTFTLADGSHLPHAGPARAVQEAIESWQTATAQAPEPPPDIASAEAGAGSPPLAPIEWDGPGNYDLDLAVAVLQEHLDRVVPPERLVAA